MIELVEANWPIFLVALLLGIAVAWFVFVGSRKTKVTRDASAEGQPASRNQALIDSEPVAKREPQPTAAEPAPEPVPTATPAESVADDLTRIKGVGPKLVTILRENGITSLEQIAHWSDADIDAIDSKLGRFEGRIRRDDWVTQARHLAAGDTAAYEAQFGKL